MDIAPFTGSTLQGIMAGAVRYAHPILTYNGQSVTGQVGPSLMELTYKEGTEQKGDSVDFKIADPEGKFRLTWSFKAATSITLALESENWNFVGERTYRDCGSFQINRVTISQAKKSGTTIAMSATSIPVKSSARLEKKNRAWTDSNLKAMAQEIAKDNGWTLQYQAKENPKISRSDQHDESDFVLLDRHCHENDLFVKVKNNQLWIISKEELEQQSPSGTIICPTPGNPGGVNGQGGIEHWELSESTEDTYKGSEVKFRDGKTGTTIVGTCTDPSATVGDILRDKYFPHPETTQISANAPMKLPAQLSGSGWLPPLVDKVWAHKPYPTVLPGVETNPSTSQKAQRVAKSKLKKKNRKGKHHSMVIPLNLRIEAGNVYTLQGFSPDFDGNWLLTECEHKFAAKSGSTTSMTLQMCIKGY